MNLARASGRIDASMSEYMEKWETARMSVRENVRMYVTFFFMSEQMPGIHTCHYFVRGISKFSYDKTTSSRHGGPVLWDISQGDSSCSRDEITSCATTTMAASVEICGASAVVDWGHGIAGNEPWECTYSVCTIYIIYNYVISSNIYYVICNQCICSNQNWLMLFDLDVARIETDDIH